MIQFGCLHAQTRLDVAQALAKGDLGKRHRQKLIETCERLDLVISTITSHAKPKGAQWQVLGQLRKDQLAKNLSILLRRSSIPMARAIALLWLTNKTQLTSEEK
jgi:hypothetical protein